MYEGGLVWRINKQKSIDLHVLLFEDIIVLLQKQDDKLVLRMMERTLHDDGLHVTHLQAVI